MPAETRQEQAAKAAARKIGYQAPAAQPAAEKDLEEEASKERQELPEQAEAQQAAPAAKTAEAERTAEARPDPLGKEESVVGAPTVVREEEASKERQGLPEPPVVEAAAEAPQEEAAPQGLKKTSQESAKRALAAPHHCYPYGES
ncbi:hypothetical protein KY327_03305 [Candidatus Woesearchaeota archaeon]|nr:hypothetical protein [Candidatus Woesearchaeota archaeon]